MPTPLVHRSLVASVLLVCGMTASAFDTAQLTGRWYGESERSGQQHRFLLTRNADGTFSMDYRIYVDNTLMVSRRQDGQWALKDGNVYWARTTKITDDTGSYPPPTATGYYEDAYSIVELDNAQMKTRHQVSGSETVVKRAAEGFALK
jgi:hypothetical protein